MTLRYECIIEYLPRYMSYEAVKLYIHILGVIRINLHAVHSFCVSHLGTLATLLIGQLYGGVTYSTLHNAKSLHLDFEV